MRREGGRVDHLADERFELETDCYEEGRCFEWFLFVSVVPSFVSRSFPVVVLYLADFVSCSLFLSNDLTCFTHLTRQAVYPSELCKNRE